MAANGTRTSRRKTPQHLEQAPNRTEEIIGRYRAQEARLTRWLLVTTAIAAAAVVFIVYSVLAGHASNAGPAIAGTLACLGAAGQVRSRRSKLRRFLESGAAEQIATRTAAAESDPGTPRPDSLFSQQYCRVSPAIAGGRLQAGPVPAAFLVVVRDGQLVVVEAPGIPLLRAPAAAIQIQKPPRNLLGAGSVLRVGTQLLLVDFSGVYAAEQRKGALRQMVSVGNVSGSIRGGREINDGFVAALLESGATAATG
jgi:hypothetical protein